MGIGNGSLDDVIERVIDGSNGGFVVIRCMMFATIFIGNIVKLSNCRDGLSSWKYLEASVDTSLSSEVVSLPGMEIFGNYMLCRKNCMVSEIHNHLAFAIKH